MAVETNKKKSVHVNALQQKPARHVETRSSLEELEVEARSGHEMKKTLSRWDLMWFGMGVVIGTGIYVLTGLEARDDPAVVLSYFAFSGLSPMLCLLLYRNYLLKGA